MKAKLEAELEGIKEALKAGTVTNSEYCEIYYAISQRIKNL